MDSQKVQRFLSNSSLEKGTEDESPARQKSRAKFDEASSRNLQFSDGRRRSDGQNQAFTKERSTAFQALQEEANALPATNRSQKKLKTMPAPSQDTRHDDVHLDPTALARLHKMHEDMKTATHEDKAHEDMSDKAMLAAWGPKGSWTLYGDLPAEREKPHNVRGFELRPADKARCGESLLASCGVNAINTKGRKGWTDTSPGQDNCSVSLLDDGWEVYCVMDGHGPGGEWPATRSVRTMPYILQTSTACKTMLRQGKAASALMLAFEKCQEDLVRESWDSDIELVAAGCTAVCILKHPNKKKVWVATAGDSRVILLVPGFGVVNTTVDHKPSVESECARCEAMGCDIIRTEHDDGFVEERVNIKGEDFPGLCMTRSLGDLSVKEVGVLAEPEVLEWPLDKFPNALILAASDGVWEFLTNEQVCQIVLGAIEKGSSYAKACKLLVTASQEIWREKEDFYCDDITVVLAAVGHKVSQRASKGSECCGGGLSRCSIM